MADQGQFEADRVLRPTKGEAIVPVAREVGAAQLRQEAVRKGMLLPLADALFVLLRMVLLARDLLLVPFKRLRERRAFCVQSSSRALPLI